MRSAAARSNSIRSLRKPGGSGPVLTVKEARRRCATHACLLAVMLVTVSCTRGPVSYYPLRAAKAVEVQPNPARSQLHTLWQRRRVAVSNCDHAIDASDKEPAFRELERLERYFRHGKKPLATREDRQAFCNGIRAQAQDDPSRWDRTVSSKELAKLCDFYLSVNPRTPFSDPRVGWDLRKLEVVLCNASELIGVPLTPPPLVSTIPIPILNAWTIGVGGTERRLILLNEAFFVYPQNLAKDVIQVLKPEVGGDGSLIRVDRKSILDAIRADPDVLTNYEANMLYYLAEGERPDDWVLQPDLAPKGRALLNENAIYLASAMQVFALGHEYAHQLLKHQVVEADPKNGPGVSPGFVAPSRARMWAQELEADSYGFLLMAAALTRAEEDGRTTTGYSFPFAVTAPRLLLAFWAAAERRDVIANGGTPAAPVSEEDEAMAIDAVRHMFLPAGLQRDSQVGSYVPPSVGGGRPPLWLRALLVRDLERHALAMHGGSTDMLDREDLYAYAQSILEEEILRRHRLKINGHWLPRDEH